MTCSQTVATWLSVIATLILATVAVFQETVRGWFYEPRFTVIAKTEPPHCVAVPVTSVEGTFIASSVYLRIWVKNIGNATARNAEVYVQEVRRRRADSTWEPLNSFPSMNLKWANFGAIYFPRIAPGMGKHCDLGHIVDPSKRQLLREDAPHLSLTGQQASLAFDLMAAPNHRGHIVGPGVYQVDVIVAAENARPLKQSIELTVKNWFPDGATMLRDGVGLKIAG